MLNEIVEAMNKVYIQTNVIFFFLYLVFNFYYQKKFINHFICGHSFKYTICPKTETW